MAELTEFLVHNLVKDSEMVSVKEFDSEDDTTIIEVLVSENDIGAVIGKGGKIANSIRTIVQAAAYTNNLKKVKINIDSF